MLSKNVPVGCHLLQLLSSLFRFCLKKAKPRQTWWNRKVLQNLKLPEMIQVQFHYHYATALHLLVAQRIHDAQLGQKNKDAEWNCLSRRSVEASTNLDTYWVEKETNRILNEDTTCGLEGRAKRHLLKRAKDEDASIPRTTTAHSGPRQTFHDCSRLPATTIRW